MPVTISDTIQLFDQDRFGQIAFEVMRHAFAIHNELGRFFHEQVYQEEWKQRLGDRASTEVGIRVTHNDFQKVYRMDLLVDHGAVFELKSTEQLHEQHRSQVIHYLMLTGLAHAKLINFRPEKVEHLFVNTNLSGVDRRVFRVQTERWKPTGEGLQRFQEVLVEILRDWGTCLDLHLYEEAVTHFLGGPTRVNRDVDVVRGGRSLGRQTVRLVNPGTAFKLTSLRRNLQAFESHTKRFLKHTNLHHVLWVNITLEEVSFALISR